MLQWNSVTTQSDITRYVIWLNNQCDKNTLKLKSTAIAYHTSMDLTNTTVFHQITYGEGQNMHYSDAIMSVMTYRTTGVPIVCSTVCPDADQRKHQSIAPSAPSETGGFPSRRTSNARNGSIWWRYHVYNINWSCDSRRTGSGVNFRQYMWYFNMNHVINII